MPCYENVSIVLVLLDRNCLHAIFEPPTAMFSVDVRQNLKKINTKIKVVSSPGMLPIFFSHQWEYPLSCFL